METGEKPIDPALNAARLGALRAARAVELDLRRRRADLAEGPSSLEILGRYLRHSRRLSHMTQQALADKAGVSQSMVSRAERGVAGAMPVERLLAMVRPLDRLFPFGCCPHDHECPWQPIRPPQLPATTKETLFIERMLKFAGEP